MKDFFEQFKDNLENRPEPLHEEHLWNRLERDLNRNDKPPVAGFGWWWALGAFCLLLLGSNLFSLLELQKVNQRMQVLDQKRDTIYLNKTETKTIYKTDTLIQTKIIREENIRYIASQEASDIWPGEIKTNRNAFNEAPFFWTPFKESQRENFQFRRLSSLQGEKRHLGVSPIYSGDLLADYNSNKKVKNSILIDGKKTKKTFHYNYVENISMLQLNSFNNEFNIRTNSEIQEINYKKRKTASQYLYAMRPKNIQFGATVGSAFLINDDLKSGFGFSAGLNAAIVFSPSLQLWLNSTYTAAEIKSSELNETIPDPSEDLPIGSNFQFSIVEASPSFLQYSIGLQYFFNANKKWKPFLGLGYAAEQYLSYDLSYEYQDINDPGLEWTTKDRVEERQVSDLLLIRTGIEYQISNHWNWQFKLDYRRDLKKQTLLAPDLINIQTGINYIF